MAREINRMSSDWLAVKAWAENERAELIECLIAQENEEHRGRIKQLDELLALPDSLDKGSVSL